jgi:hypothetical protein
MQSQDASSVEHTSNVGVLNEITEENHPDGRRVYKKTQDIHIDNYNAGQQLHIKREFKTGGDNEVANLIAQNAMNVTELLPGGNPVTSFTNTASPLIDVVKKKKEGYREKKHKNKKEVKKPEEKKVIITDADSTEELLIISEKKVPDIVITNSMEEKTTEEEKKKQYVAAGSDLYVVEIESPEEKDVIGNIPVSD